ncbi:D(2)-like dopamine receptor [Mugil cephalus]|uniref:D(2)-like dopamine receptor n=1 Tax=Mugil cephalus TaxID=48193 RepID=UPI001FB706F9|nr:D(2)-like dopamine receptor [Mugil cephalus]
MLGQCGENEDAEVNSLKLEMGSEPSPARESGNNTVWKEYIDITFVVINSLILLITAAVGMAANIFVILAVYRQKSLQTSNNALVVNLAVIDVLRCVIDCPLLLTINVTVYQRGRGDDLICEAQLAFFAFSCCVQLLTLACLSAERYQAIVQPFKASQRKRRITVLIPVTWTSALVVAVFCLMFLRDSPVHVRCLGLQKETLATYDSFGLFMLFPLWAVCFSVIIGFYAGIFSHVRSHNCKIFDKGTFPVPKTDTTEDKQKKEPTTVLENDKSEDNQALSGSVAQKPPEPDSSLKNLATPVINSAKPPPRASVDSEINKEKKITVEKSDLKMEQPHPFGVQTEEKPVKPDGSIFGASSGDANVKSSTSKIQTVLSNPSTDEQSKERPTADKATKEVGPHDYSSTQAGNPESNSVLPTEQTQANNSSSNGGDTLAVSTPGQEPSLTPVSSDAPEAEAINQHVAVEGAVCMMPSKASRERASKKKESKLAKRAGYIIITFLLFWLPLITTILLNIPINQRKNAQLYFQILIIEDVEILSVSIACITSLSDPIIYAAVNPQFRTEFNRLKNSLKSTFKKE